MPIYPALALLLGGAMATEDSWTEWGTRVLGVLTALCAVCIAALLYLVHSTSAPGDISQALKQHPGMYKLSMGHVGDLTIPAFAYLRVPLILAGIAFLLGTLSCWLLRDRRVYLGIALMMVLFIHAARAAMVTFDPYLSSRPLATALENAPKGHLIIDGAYYAFSSVFFYTDRDALLWNGRKNNLEYGSYAPGSASVFIEDREFQSCWNSRERYFVLSQENKLEHLQEVVPTARLFLVEESGGKALYSNLPLN